MSQDRSSTARIVSPSRRRLLQGGAAATALGLLGAPAVHAQSGPKIRVGYWPIAAGLPFYTAVELGYFKEAGLNVEVQKYAGAQQIMEGMLADRCDGSANGTGSGNLAIGELAQPGTFKIFCANPSNARNVLDGSASVSSSRQDHRFGWSTCVAASAGASSTAAAANCSRVSG